MYRTILTAMLAVVAFTCQSQDVDSSELALKKMADSLVNDLATTRQVKNLPPFGEYYIAKIGLMDGTVKRLTFYDADSTKIFVFSDTSNKILDSIYATDIRFISFREKGRAGKVIGEAAAGGLVIGGLAGYLSAPCDDCEDGDINFNGIGRGAAWGLIGGIATATVGAIISVFNNGNVSIKGNPKKYIRQYSKLQKFTVKNHKPHKPM
ncbi:MAG TPA: hypothetical protein VLA58_11615 [Chitinophagaceae bacterium]|nr:hypothetical protein [Chitinophagaceae bacterium]